MAGVLLTPEELFALEYEMSTCDVSWAELFDHIRALEEKIDQLHEDKSRLAERAVRAENDARRPFLGGGNQSAAHAQ